MRTLQLLLVALARSICGEAARTEIGGSVKADVPTTVTLINDRDYNATRILLTFYPPVWIENRPLWGTGNKCMLLKETAIKPEANNTISITIPASVAPAGTLCALDVFLYHASPEPRRGTTGIKADSNTFTLVDGTGRWSENELIRDGDLLMRPESLLCEAVDCVRRCQDAAFPYQCRRNDPSSRGNATADDATHECIRTCPGIKWLPIRVIKSVRAMELLTGGPRTPTTSTCAPTTWNTATR